MKNKKKFTTPRFSRETLKFLETAGRQKRPTWLEKNLADYERLLREPLHHLARELKRELAGQAAGYHFPQKGLGRLKRPAHRVAAGGGLFRDWMSYSASIPAKSRFDHNPSLFFLINPEDKKDPVLIAGGLYMPSSRQLRAIREAIAEDATPFDRLFASREFKKVFPDGFSDERISSRPPRGFDPQHPRLAWLKLQGFFVWKPYSMREFSSVDFPALVARDFRQILRLNSLLYQILHRVPGTRLSEPETPKGLRTGLPEQLSDRLDELAPIAREMDF
jgi:uncharacterized protein (TIGR02453 family)